MTLKTFHSCEIIFYASRIKREFCEGILIVVLQNLPNPHSWRNITSPIEAESLSKKAYNSNKPLSLIIAKSSFLFSPICAIRRWISSEHKTWARCGSARNRIPYTITFIHCQHITTRERNRCNRYRNSMKSHCRRRVSAMSWSEVSSFGETVKVHRAKATRVR